MAQLDPQLIAELFSLTSGVGYLMVMSGVGKSLLTWKRRLSLPVLRPPALLLLRLARGTPGSP